ncbi:MAG: ADP-ribosylglycohydrolase family protein [Victivallales bacterium]|jgi:ADP-ribosylglycohydrolase|nr:ADP-ribosylglycohydrolase family protein [Victivallales bacterium]
MDSSVYQDKVRGAWFGKCLAGAIGMPFEGVPFAVELTEEQIYLKDVPNDDLELQLVWMDALKKHGIALRCTDLADNWLHQIKHGCDEYSTTIHNMQHGIMPPQSGAYNNFFADGMGATIRSEIWALLFPERPDAAGFFAQQDAEVDHWGDGVRGEIFMAMAEAHACVHSNIEEALRFAYNALDKESRLYRTLTRVFEMYDKKVSDFDAKNDLWLPEQRNFNFTDCVMNLSFIVHSLLRGKGDFLKTVLLAVSFGRDTDCTAASCGAFLGIAKGMKVFPKQWLGKVKNELCLSAFVTAIPGVPLTLDDLVAQTLELHNKLEKQLPAEKYPAYTHCQLPQNPPKFDHSSWLILDDEQFDIPAIEKQLRATGKCPEELKKYVVSFDTLFLDLSRFARDFNRLHLFSFLTVNHNETPVDEIMMSVTADVGERLWMDGIRLTNHHSRAKMLPSFHRAEGGVTFHMALKPGEKHFFHWELAFCIAPLRACLMFGNSYNDHLDGFDFNI